MKQLSILLLLTFILSCKTTKPPKENKLADSLCGGLPERLIFMDDSLQAKNKRK